MKTQTITIAGMHRLGVSIGMAIKQSSLDVNVIGCDSDNSLANAALKSDAIDKAQRSLARAAADADILLLTVPVSEQEATLDVVGQFTKEHTLIIDLTGLKEAGVKWAKTGLRKGHYVGASLVLAADALLDSREGQESASASLFRNSVFCIMPSAKTDPKAVETAVNFGRVLGATPYFVDPLEYDSLVQGVETVPGLLAAAMFNTVHQSTGWRDILRFAGLPFAQTTQPLTAGTDIARLAMGNKIATLRWLDALLEELQKVRRWVNEGEEEVLGALLTELDKSRDIWLQDRQENNWIEIKETRVEGPSLSRQMLGGLSGLGRDRDD